MRPGCGGVTCGSCFGTGRQVKNGISRTCSACYGKGRR